jgi:hypothetical protein
MPVAVPADAAPDTPPAATPASPGKRSVRIVGPTFTPAQ